MADLFFRVRASYDEAIDCRRELKKVEEQIKNLDTDASPNKINALLKKHAELSAKWENNISSFGKFGASALQIFDKIGSAIKRDTKELDSVGDASERLLSTTQKRLLMEERIQENIKKQKASAEQRKSYLEEGLARNQASLQQREQRLKEKNGYKDEGFYSEEDRKSLEEARKHVENWLKPLKDVSAQIIDYNRQLEESNKRAGEHKAILENIKAPDIDLKSNIDDLTSQIETGEKTLDKLKKDLVDMETELSQRQTPQGAAKYFQESKDKMYSIFGDIESKKKEIDSLQSAVDSFNVSGQVAQQQQLESYAAELTENIKKEDDEIGSLTQKLSSLNEQSVLYKQTQDEIDFHLAEREKYVQLLQSTNTAIHDSQASIESEVRAQEERQSKIKELSADIGNLSTEYEKQKNLVNDPSANQKAIDGLQQEISKKKEQIELTARENQAMQDLLSQAQDVYYPDNAEKALADMERLDDEFLKANKDVQELSDAMKQSLELENIETAKEKLSEISAKMQEIVEKSRELQSKKIVQQDIVRENTQKQKFDTANADEYQKKIDEANDAIEEINNKLAENGREYVALKNEQAEYTQTLNDASGHQEKIRTQIMAAREELARMIAEGKQGTPEFAEMAEQAGELRQQMQISSAAMDYFGNENRHMDTLKDTLQGVAGGFSVVTGVMGIFNKDAAEMEAIQTKIQSSLGVIIGLESVYAKVKNTSNIMLTIGAVQSWAAAKADAAATAAKEAGTIATIKATAAQSAFNLIAKANPYVLLVTAILSLVGGIYLLVKAYDKEMTEEEKAMQRHKEHTEIVRKQQKEWSDSVAKSASSQIASYRRLQNKWEELGNNMTKKRKFIKDNQQAFHGLGIAVNSVSAAENVFVKNTDAVVAAITARAKAAAYQSLIQEEFERQIRAENYKTADTGNYAYRVSAGQKAKVGKNKAYTQAQSGGYAYQEGDIDANGNWTTQGAKRFNEASEKSRQKRAEMHKKELAERKKLSDERVKSYQDGAKKEAEAANKLLKDAGIKEYEGGSGGSGTSSAERAEKEKTLLDKQARDRERQAKDLEFSTREAQIKAMEEGTQKVLAQIELDHDREVEAINRSYEDMRLKRIEAAKQLWESDQKNKGKNFYESSEYQKALSSPMQRNATAEELASIQEKERKLIEGFADNDIIEKIKEQYGQGNVDVIARPVIDAAKLAAKGWSDVGDGIATVYSMQETVLDNEGNERQILFTPILPDGNVLSPQEIDDYLKNVLDGSDILNADTKNIVIKVGNIGEDIDLGGEELHKLHEQLFDGDMGQQIKEWYQSITDAEKYNMLARLNASEAEYTKKKMEQQKVLIQSMRDYLKEYGSFYQKQTAITEKYEEDIKKARANGDKGEELRLTKKYNQDIQKAKINDITMGIDWKTLMNGVGNMIPTMMKPMLEKLEEYTRSDEFKVAGAENQQKVMDLLAELHRYVDSENRVDWHDLSEAMQKFDKAVDAYRKAQAAEAIAVKIRDEKKTAYERGEISEEEYQTAVKIANGLGDITAKTRESMEEYGQAVNDTTTAITNATTGITKALEKSGIWKLSDGFGGLQSFGESLNAFTAAAQESLANMKEGGTRNVADSIVNGVTKAADSIGGGLESILSSGIGQIVGIIAMIPKLILQFIEAIKNFVTGILNAITEIIRFEWLSDLVNSILDALGELIESIFHIPEKLVNAIGSIITEGIGGLLGNVLNGITFGGFNSWIGGSESDENFDADMERLNSTNERLINAIEKLTKQMSDSTYGDIEKYYSQQLAALNTLTKNTQEQLERSLKAYYDGGWFHSDIASSGKEIRNRITPEQYLQLIHYTSPDESVNAAAFSEMTDEQIAAVMQTFAQNMFGSLSGGGFSSMLANMTPEEWDRIRNELPSLWEDIVYYASMGYEDASQYLEAYADLAVRRRDIEIARLESINKISFDSLEDSFLNVMKSIEKDAGDTAEEISKIMANALNENWYNANLKNRLKKWYEDLSEALKLTNKKEQESRLADLRQQYQNMMDEARRESAIINEMTGYTEASKSQEQSATFNSAQNITYEQADALVGILTAQLIVQEQGKADLSLLTASVSQLTPLYMEQRDIAADSRDILAGMAIHVEEIRDGVVDTIVPRIKNIDNNLDKVYKLVEAQ